jgi:HD-like signal output (HDOD) protein
MSDYTIAAWAIVILAELRNGAMETAKVIAAQVGDLPTLPHVATKVMELLSGDDSSASDLDRVISRDQALTARVLKLAIRRSSAGGG